MNISEVYDLIIIGGGPAGMAAGIYSSRKKMKTFIISKDLQGQMKWATHVENYPGTKNISGLDLVKDFEEHLREYDAEIVLNEVIQIKKENKMFEVIDKDGNRHLGLSVVIASGANPRTIDVKGEKEYLGKGVAYCTTCDAPFFKDKIVAVIGGGNSGFQAAEELLKYASKIYLLERNDELRADQYVIDQLKDKIDIITSAEIKSIEGNNFVEKIIYEDKKSKKMHSINLSGVFILSGTQPATTFIDELVDFDDRKKIVIDLNNKTKTEGLFSAGDCSNIPYNQIIIAAGEGAKAALSAYDYLREIQK